MKQKSFQYWQWRTLIVLMIGYACYYFLRKNFSTAIPAMEATLGLSKAQLGAFLTANGIVYGISRFVNGIIADRANKRRMMTLGLLLSCAISLLISFSPKFNGFLHLLDAEGKATVGLVYLIGSLWVLNGYVHGMGYPPVSSLMAHWFRPKELATKQSLWNASHSLGAGAVVALCGWLLSRFGYSAWNLCFVIPAAIAFVGAIITYFGLRETPSDLGFPEVEELERIENGEISEAEAETEREMTGPEFRRFARHMVYRNPYVWVSGLTNFNVYVIRLAILDWGTTILTQYRGLEIGLAASIVAGSELIGGVLGSAIAGWLTDKVFHHRVFRCGALCTILSTICLFLFWRLPAGASWVWNAVLIILSAFFVYGVSGLCGIGASKYATKKAAASSNGFVGIIAYVATVLSGFGFGLLADNPRLGWDAVFVVTLSIGVLGTIIQALFWNAPEDGYPRKHEYEREFTEIPGGPGSSGGM
ncbi:MAG: MFS transporter [Bacteroidales bacterium]|nr:MFS transporter [Bacteroidales bacterium]